MIDILMTILTIAIWELLKHIQHVAATVEMECDKCKNFKLSANRASKRWVNDVMNQHKETCS